MTSKQTSAFVSNDAAARFVRRRVYIEHRETARLRALCNHPCPLVLFDFARWADYRLRLALSAVESRCARGCSQTAVSGVIRSTGESDHEPFRANNVHTRRRNKRDRKEPASLSFCLGSLPFLRCMNHLAQQHAISSLSTD